MSVSLELSILSFVTKLWYVFLLINVLVSVTKLQALNNDNNDNFDRHVQTVVVNANNSISTPNTSRLQLISNNLSNDLRDKIQNQTKFAQKQFDLLQTKRKILPRDLSDATQTTNSNNNSRVKLPTWFNYNLYKAFFGKTYTFGAEDDIHKRIYLKTALKVFEQRALFRSGRSNTLPSINELSDLVSFSLNNNYVYYRHLINNIN